MRRHAIAFLLAVSCSPFESNELGLEPAPGVAVATDDSASPPSSAAVAPDTVDAATAPQTASDAGPDADADTDAEVVADASYDAEAGSDSADADSAVEDASADSEAPRYGVATGGGSQWLELPWPPVAGLTALTLEGWFKVDTLSDNGHLFRLRSAADEALCALAGDSYALEYRGRLTCIASGAQVWSAVALPIGSWHHIAFVFGAGSFTMYVDGASQGSVAHSSPFADSGSERGFTVNGSSRPAETVQGVIDEFRLSNVARYSGPFTPPLHLDADGVTLSSMMLDEGQGQPSGATLIGGPTWVPVTR